MPHCMRTLIDLYWSALEDPSHFADVFDGRWDKPIRKKYSEMLELVIQELQANFSGIISVRSTPRGNPGCNKQKYGFHPANYIDALQGEEVF